MYTLESNLWTFLSWTYSHVWTEEEKIQNKVICFCLINMKYGIRADVPSVMNTSAS